MGKMTHGPASPKKQQKIAVPPAQSALQQKFTEYLTLLSGGTEQDLSRHGLSRHTGKKLSIYFLVDDSGRLSLSVLQIRRRLDDFSKTLFLPFIFTFLRLLPVGSTTPSSLTGTGYFKEVAAQALYPYCITSKTV